MNRIEDILSRPTGTCWAFSLTHVPLPMFTHVQETSKARARKAAACLRCSRSPRSFARRRCSPVPRVRSCSRRSGAHSLMRPQLPRATAASSPVRPPLPIPPAPHSSARPPARAAAPPFTAGVGPRYITRRPELSWSCTRHSACSQIRVATGCGRRDARAVPPWQVKSSAACGAGEVEGTSGFASLRETSGPWLNG